jgi:hypothetical protein
METGKQQSISSRPRSHPWIMPKRFGSIAAQLPPANILCQADFPQIGSIAPFVTFPKRITVPDLLAHCVPKRFGIFVDFACRERTMPFFNQRMGILRPFMFSARRRGPIA